MRILTDVKISDLLHAMRLIRFSMRDCHNKDVALNYIHKEIERLKNV